jgi:hypothetical protein
LLPTRLQVLRLGASPGPWTLAGDEHPPGSFAPCLPFPFLLRETELPNPNVSYFCYLCLKSAPPFVSPRRDPYGVTPSILPGSVASALPRDGDGATASAPRATVCCLRI